MKFTISLRHIHQWFGGEIAPALDAAALIEQSGMDALSVVDHILMGEDLSGYPYGTPHFEPRAHWWEPGTLLAAIAARTTRIRLATSIIVSPLRPAALLAKQLTTLDRLSGGRVDAGFGVGWQRAEYDACGVPWANRFAQMEEQIGACRALWSEAPATFKGRYVSFERVSQLPFPLQRGGIPIWLGVNDSDRNLDRVATLADGWCPPNNDPARLAVALEKLRRRLDARGRDPDSFQTRVVLPIIKGPSGPDLDASLARVAECHKLGVTHMEIAPAVFGRSLGDLDGILRAIGSAG